MIRNEISILITLEEGKDNFTLLDVDGGVPRVNNYKKNGPFRRSQVEGEVGQDRIKRGLNRRIGEYFARANDW